MWGGCRPSSALGVLPGLDAQPSPWDALGQQRTRALKEFIHEKTQGPSGRQSTGYKLQKLLSGPGRGLGGRQGPWGRRADAGSCGC